ncbi:hypothetical protein TWF788_005220 [Orbilia oligospora]|uniref:Uncharacterized protein n=1 Tax=Orbilia oligospora TaxID=2813651 RepID=A0A7C8U6F6_ORBOL|nr:hypothetical protein TWF788_005220 [Orbilia oligospora]
MFKQCICIGRNGESWKKELKDRRCWGGTTATSRNQLRGSVKQLGKQGAKWRYHAILRPAFHQSVPSDLADFNLDDGIEKKKENSVEERLGGEDHFEEKGRGSDEEKDDVCMESVMLPERTDEVGESRPPLYRGGIEDTDDDKDDGDEYEVEGEVDVDVDVDVDVEVEVVDRGKEGEVEVEVLRREPKNGSTSGPVHIFTSPF